MGIIFGRFNIVLAVIYRELRRQRSIIKIALNVSVYIADDVICSSAVTLCPYFSLGFLLSLLDYCVICSSPVELIRNLDQDPNYVIKIKLVNKCRKICLMSTCMQTKV